ncbi:MAG: DUF4388 domain-containing protein [Candidatus Eiseniibacteriota bacterium]
MSRNSSTASSLVGTIASATFTGGGSPARATGGTGEQPLLSGRLDQTDLFEICQFIHMGTKTGILEVEAPGKRGVIWFDQGQIVNAVDDALAEGEAAAYRIFSWAGGTFAFRVQAVAPMRTIHSGTESLLLDIARFMDERREESAQRGEGPEDDRPEQWTHEEGLRRRQESGEELRQLFATLREGRGTAGGDDPLARLWERARTGGHDAVLVRPGEPALALREGLATALPDAAADDTVAMAIAALGASDGGSRRRNSPVGPFILSLITEAGGEALFLQAVPESIEWSAAGLPDDWLDGMASCPRGLAWLGAPPASGRSRTARTLAEEFSVRGRFTVLLAEGAVEGASGALSVRATDPVRVSKDLRQALHEGASAVILDLVRGVRAGAVAHAAARSLVVACEPTPDLRTLLLRASRHSRARDVFVGALFVTLGGGRGHYESLWLPEEARLGLDLARHPDRLLALSEDPAATCDAGPLSVSYDSE